MDLVRFRLIEEYTGGMRFILSNGDCPEKPGLRTPIIARIARKKVVAKKNTKVVIERIEYWD